MRMHHRIDRSALRRLVALGAAHARRSGQPEAIARWCEADEEPRTLDRLVYHVSDLLGLGGEPRAGFVLLDAGGGSGLLAVIACLMGASRAIVLDTHRHLIDFLATLAPQLRPEAHVESHQRDVTRTRLPAGSVDVALCNESLSHLIDVEGFLLEASRLLAPGGRLIISDSNNESNPRVRRARRKEWERFERVGGQGSEPGELFQKRCGLIGSSFPGLPAGVVEEIAADTFGMRGEEILRAARRRLDGGCVEASRFDPRRCPVDPVSDQCADRLFKPYELGRAIDRHGLRPRVVAHFATRPPYRALNALWGAASPLTLPFSRAFRIVAIKKESSA